MGRLGWTHSPSTEAVDDCVYEANANATPEGGVA
jgi:hypothetical protein